MKSIMVVDDEPEVLNKIKSCLERDHFEVITASNSRQALELMEGDKEDNVGLMLIDTFMPGGSEGALFSMRPKSKQNVGTLEDFLQKPFTEEELLDFVRQRHTDE